MSIIKKILGICATPPPTDASCWNYSQGEIEIDMNLAPELKNKNGAIRLEGKGLPGKILVFQGEDGLFYALRNRCTHIGHRRLDPMEGEQIVKCCSVMGSTYAYDGKRLSGPARKDLDAFSTRVRENRLIVSMT